MEERGRSTVKVRKTQEDQAKEVGSQPDTHHRIPSKIINELGVLSQVVSEVLREVG
jgi:hypothetical protein